MVDLCTHVAPFPFHFQTYVLIFNPCPPHLHHLHLLLSHLSFECKLARVYYRLIRDRSRRHFITKFYCRYKTVSIKTNYLGKYISTIDAYSNSSFFNWNSICFHNQTRNHSRNTTYGGSLLQPFDMIL